jgi:hypothetical protein
VQRSAGNNPRRASRRSLIAILCGLALLAAALRRAPPGVQNFFPRAACILIGSLYALMTLTWSEIDWRLEQPTAQRLLREGGGDQRQIAEFFAGFALATAGSRR